MDNHFPTTGTAPAVKEVQAIAFHDGDGRIHHIHHLIVLEGGRSLDREALMREARDQARSLGVDVSRLDALHVANVENPHAMHRVDVQRGVLVEAKAPTPNLETEAGGDSREGLEQVGRGLRVVALILAFAVVGLLILLYLVTFGSGT